MNDREWAAFLDALAPEQRHVAQTLMLRITTLLERERSQALASAQAVERRLDRKRTNIADLRMVIEDQERRIKALEGRLNNDE